MSFARCPACRSTLLAITEVHDEYGQTDYGQHEVGDGVIFPSSEFIFSAGDPTRVLMLCGECGHEWRSRRVVA